MTIRIQKWLIWTVVVIVFTWLFISFAIYTAPHVDGKYKSHILCNNCEYPAGYRKVCPKCGDYPMKQKVVVYRKYYDCYFWKVLWNKPIDEFAKNPEKVD